MIGAAVLAASASWRLGRPTPLLACRGTTRVRAIAVEACASRVDRVAIVVGAGAAEIAAAVVGLAVAIEANWLWPEGSAASVRCATAWAIRSRCDALCLIGCIQPRLTAAHLDRLVAAFEQLGGRTPVASAYAGALGLPAVFGREAFSQLLGLGGDHGVAALLAAGGVGALDWPDGALDGPDSGLDCPDGAPDADVDRAPLRCG
jgi:molybdenum cofactor cytidylyltransferase